MSRMPPIAKQFEDHKTSADDDRGIGHIECVPVVVANVEVDEVGDAVPRRSIENVTRRSAENQCEASLTEPAASASCDEKPEQQCDDSRRKNDKDRCEPR